MRRIIPAFVFVAACGVAPQDHKVSEYYVEDGKNSGDATKVPGQATPGATATNTSTATATGTPGAAALHFLTPSADTPATGKLSVKVQLTGESTAATWTLAYFISDPAKDATVIAKDMPSTETSYDWDTSAVPAGVYGLSAVITDGGATVQTIATAKITIAALPVPTPGKPVVALVFPTGQNAFVAGTPQNIQYTGKDASGNALTYKIEYSADGGGTWTLVADKQAVTSYAWDVKGLAQGTNYLLRVTADDGKGGTGVAVTPKAFGVATTDPSFAGQLGPLLKTRCGTCHNAAGPQIAFFEDDNYDLATVGVKDQTANIMADVANNKMPPTGATPLTAAEKDIITLWEWDGAK